jgi:hypothetical protein
MQLKYSKTNEIESSQKDQEKTTKEIAVHKRCLRLIPPTQQHLHRPINPQPIPQISHLQRLPRLLSRKPHLHNPIDGFLRRVLVRRTSQYAMLRRMLLESRVCRVIARLADMCILLIHERGVQGGGDGVAVSECWVACERWDCGDGIVCSAVGGVFFDRGHAHCYAVAVADAGDCRGWWCGEKGLRDYAAGRGGTCASAWRCCCGWELCNGSGRVCW